VKEKFRTDFCVVAVLLEQTVAQKNRIFLLGPK
jgi:hypothetical protein